MKITEEKTEERIVKYTKTKEVLCNNCGKSMSLKAYDDTLILAGCNIKVLFEYGSNKDGCMHKFDLCDDCYDEVVETFRHKVEATESDYYTM